MNTQLPVSGMIPYGPAQFQPLPKKDIEASSSCYGPNGLLQSSVSPFGQPKICYTCPNPNTKPKWKPCDIPKEMDPVRHNIYYGGMICAFEPRDTINNTMMDRIFLNSPARPPFDYKHAIDTEFYLRHGESKSCSKYWEYRYDNKNHMMGDSGKYQRIGPAPLENQ